MRWLPPTLLALFAALWFLGLWIDDLLITLLWYVEIYISFLPQLAWNSLCRPGWPWTHSALPASASWVLGLKACTTKPGYFFFSFLFSSFLFFFFLFFFFLYRSPCSPRWPGTHFVDQAGLISQRSTCLCLPSTGIKAMYHHPLLSSQYILFVILILCVWVYCLMYVSVPLSWNGYGDQKRVVDPLELELWTIVSSFCVLGINPRSSVRAVSAFNCWTNSPVPLSQYF